MERVKIFRQQLVAGWCLRLVCLLSLGILSNLANADWTLRGEQSSVSFVTTKAVDVGEVHYFKTLSGAVDSAGDANLSIDLTSVDTSIPIRDERMQNLLFDTDRFPNATLSTQVPIQELADLQAGATRDLTLEGTLGIRGISAPVVSNVKVIKLRDGSLQVASKSPVLVSAKELNLLEGVEKLREVAGLSSIGGSVAVSFQLNFRP